MKPTRFPHPNPALNRAVEIGALGVTVIMATTAPLQVLLTLLGAPGGLFVLSAFFTLVLAAPVLMLTAYAPEVTVSDEGLTIHPVVWKDRFIQWSDITAVKVYPLMPHEDAETVRRAAVGRNNYVPANGIMLVVPGLPLQYRIAGFLAGERAKPVIALTNRAHVDYAKLVRVVLSNTRGTIQDDELRASSHEN